MNSNTQSLGSRTVLYISLLIWLGVSAVVGYLGVLAKLPLPPPAIILIVSAVLLAILALSRPIRKAALSISPALFVEFHLVRLLAGINFLFLAKEGALPAEFALPAGWGDITVAVLAIPVLWFCLPVRTTGQRMGLLVWNILGLIDILGVIGNAMRLFLPNLELARPFTTLPLALLPLFVVPIVVVTHVVLFVALKKKIG